MTVVIKEMHVHTVVEKKVVQQNDIQESVYRRLRDEVVRELARQRQREVIRKRQER